MEHTCRTCRWDMFNNPKGHDTKTGKYHCKVMCRSMDSWGGWQRPLHRRKGG